MSNERYICIHGHFYQPPRENPWLEAVELQESAYPYHDWNERVAAECYEPNGASRILDGEGRIVAIVNNYARMSFDFGPTLLRWMQEKSPEAYANVLEADRASREIFSGHGSAMAQAYNHTILPLMNTRDRRTQVVWGIADFRRRFEREPEGMWLPETAVDTECLELMAEQGILFTVLAPHQAKAFRALDVPESEWQDVNGARIDPTRAYLQKLPSGKSIAIFFYDGPVSRAIAFEKLLANGETFASRLANAFSDARDWPQLVNVATDGETYGHHHRHGEMALSYAVRFIEERGLAKVTNYAAYLAAFPPRHEVEIVENSSWSCAHGIERWRNECGCNSGTKPGWNQKWRAPLRSALDGLRDRLAPLYETKAGTLLADPWEARDAYISVVLDRSRENVDRFLDERARSRLSDAERTTALELLEIQRDAMLMYTSCGWFFDELSGIETVQVLQYAGRALKFAPEVLGEDLEGPFLAALSLAPSNLPEHANGRAIYEKWVAPAAVDLQRAAAHYALSSLFETFGEKNRIYVFEVERHEARVERAGRAKLSLGWCTVTSTVTRASLDVSYGVLHLGDHNVTGGLRLYRGFGNYKAMVSEVSDAFARADLPDVIRILDRDLLELRYSIRSLFRDEQRKVLNLVLQSTLAEAEAVFTQLYEHHAPLLRFLLDLNWHLPKPFFEAASLVLNASLRDAIVAESLDVERIRQLLDEAARDRVTLDGAGLGFALAGALERMVSRLAKDPKDADLLQRLRGAAELVKSLPFEVDLWRVQNVYYRLMQATFPEAKENGSSAWVTDFVSVGGSLGIRVAA